MGRTMIKFAGNEVGLLRVPFFAAGQAGRCLAIELSPMRDPKATMMAYLVVLPQMSDGTLLRLKMLLFSAGGGVENKTHT